MTELTQYIPDEGTMLRFGKKLAEVLVKQPKDNAIVLYFNGFPTISLSAGVKSPSLSLSAYLMSPARTPLA